MKLLAPLGLLLLASQAGCTVTAVSAQEDPRPNNACESDSDCTSAEPARCRQGMCQALNGQIEGLLVAVTPASDSDIPHLTLVADVQDIPTSGGKRDLLLPQWSQLTASLELRAGTCYPVFTSDDPEHPLFPAVDGSGSLPADVTLSLRQSLLGVPQQVYFGQTGSELKKGGYHFDTELPSGDYDVYLVPPRGQLNCPVPPQLVRGQAIAPGSPVLKFVVSPILPLTVSLRWPKTSAPLTGWIADIVEPIGGRAISTEGALAAPFDPGELSATVEYSLALSYSPVSEAEPTDTSVQSAHELLRLRPPVGVVAPTVFFDRTALGLFDVKVADLSDIFTRLPAPVKLQGQLARLDTGAPVSGDVTLLSHSISGMDPGIFGSYQTTAKAGDDGLFEVELPPGQYSARAVPPMPAGIPPVDGALSAIEVTTWDVPADIASQAGKLLELPELAQVVGQGGVQGAQVQAVPSPQPVLVFDKAFGLAPFAPRASSALVDDTGRFAMQADPGTFDISVQASESLGFAWFVRAGVQVVDKTLDLGHANPGLPTVLTGTVTVADHTLSAAAIRAYVYLDKNQAYTRDPKQAVSVIEVAETRTLDAGTFTLLLPSSIGPK